MDIYGRFKINRYASSFSARNFANLPTTCFGDYTTGSVEQAILIFTLLTAAESFLQEIALVGVIVIPWFYGSGVRFGNHIAALLGQG